MYSIFGRNEKHSIGVFRMYYVLWNVLANFYLSHWEKYNTGVLFLPVGYDFSMWGTVLTFLVAGVSVSFFLILNVARNMRMSLPL